MKRTEALIRKATAHDLDACALLISHHESGEFEEWRSRFEQDLANPRRHFLVATIDDLVVAYGHTTMHTRTSQDEEGASPSGFFLSGLLVSPDHRREGLGTLLTIARREELRQVTDTIYYRAEPDNHATIEMHSRLGFRKVSTVKRDGRDFALFCLKLSPTG